MSELEGSISRQDAIDALATYIHHVDRAIGTGKLSDQQCVESAHSIIDELPSAERKGTWIKTSNGDHWKCSRCDCRASFWFNEENSCEWSMDMSEWLSNFCPNCGASMERGMVGGER